MRRVKPLLTAGLPLALGVIGLILLADRYEWASPAGRIVDKNTPIIPFLIMMVLLPVIGFPISLFLMIAGVKFGLLGAAAVSAAVYPAHLLISFFLANSVVKKPLQRFLQKRDYRLPRPPPDQTMVYGGIFMAVPGIPYAPKNYLLAMTDISLGAYILICWPIHILTGLPFILLGRSAAGADLRLALTGLVLLAAGFVLTKRLTEKYRKDQKTKEVP